VLGYIALPAVHNTEPTEQQNQGILHTHSEPSATFNMNHMLPVTLDSNNDDLEKAQTFFLDFGMKVAEEGLGEEIFFKGYGTEPFIYLAKKAPSDSGSSFGGAAYVVQSREELQRAEAVEGVTRISSLQAPGGGEILTLTDPAGHQVHLMHGQTEKQQEPMNLEKLVVNYEDEKPRVGRFQRFEPGPAPVYRWALRSDVRRRVLPGDVRL
jgi:hypothetical protein